MVILSEGVLVKRIKRIFPVIAFYWIVTAYIVIKSLLMNNGKLIYPLDDTYIHMAIAKNFVTHGVWGITRYEFSSSTSAPLWTALLATVYWATGVNEWSPLFLNLVFGTLCIFAADSLLAGMFSDNFLYKGILICIMLCVPLPGVTVIGMEHTLHSFLSLCFITKLIEIALTKGAPDKRNLIVLGLLSALLPVSRYEGLFLITIGIIILLLRKKPATACIVFIGSILSVGGYGLWSVAHGWFIVPNSVLLKSSLFALTSKNIFSIFSVGMGRLLHSSHLLPLFIALILSLFLSRRFISPQSPYIIVDIIAVLALIILHMQFVGIHWLYRYEAYVVLVSLVSIIYAIRYICSNGIVPFVLRKWVVLMIICCVALPMAKRAWGGIMRMPQAMNNIYLQQYQMGRFLDGYCREATVAVNDIGAVSYLADVKVFDVWGLGSLEPAVLKIQGRYQEDLIAELIKKYCIQIAAVYEGAIPRYMGQKVAIWRIHNNTVCGSDTVAFYAIAPNVCHALIDSLESFSAAMPKGIQYEIFAEACSDKYP